LHHLLIVLYSLNIMHDRLRSEKQTVVTHSTVDTTEDARSKIRSAYWTANSISNIDLDQTWQAIQYLL
jgi:hypothetical protein